MEKHPQTLSVLDKNLTGEGGKETGWGRQAGEHMSVCGCETWDGVRAHVCVSGLSSYIMTWSPFGKDKSFTETVTEIPFSIC